MNVRRKTAEQKSRDVVLGANATVMEKAVRRGTSSCLFGVGAVTKDHCFNADRPEEKKRRL